MRIGLIALIAASTMPVWIAAQTAVGVRGGVASSTLTTDELVSLSRQSGITIGGYVDLGVSGPLSLDVGAGYTQKGVTALDGGTALDLAIEYVEVPILARLSLPALGRVRPRLSGGPVFSIDVGCELRLTELEVSVSVDCDDPLLDGELDRKSVDVGALIGAGVWIDVGSRTRFSLDGMYNLGITAIGAENDPDPNRNRTFTVTAGMWYTIG